MFESVEDILEQYPEAKEFADLFEVTSLDEFASLAKQVATKVRTAKERTSPPSPEPRNPTPKHQSVADAIQSRSWADYLNAKWAAQGAENA